VSALGAVAGWLLEPAEPRARPADAPALRQRPVVAVAGLHRRCGVTTVARALGAELALRDPASACAVTSGPGGGGLPLGLPAASRLARALGPVGVHRTRTCGRLCLVAGADRLELRDAVRFLAPLVIDVEEPAEASAAAALADAVVLVGAPAAVPALARVVADTLAAVGPAPVVVLNRSGRASESWSETSHDLALPDSRAAAHLAQAGRGARGELGRAVARLADALGAGD
jgi:hypothetical protein